MSSSYLPALPSFPASEILRHYPACQHHLDLLLSRIKHETHNYFFAHNTRTSNHITVTMAYTPNRISAWMNDQSDDDKYAPRQPYQQLVRQEIDNMTVTESEHYWEF